MAREKTYKSKEPLIRIAKRELMPTGQAILVRIIGLLLSLIISAIVIYAFTKLNPLLVYGQMWEGAFGTVKRSWVTARNTATLLCIAVGLAPAFAMKFWNIGAEGQVLVGGIVTVACMKYLTNLPTALLFLVMVIASLIAGGIWGFFPGFFKAHWNTNETLFTLMMNYIAIQITSYMVALWENPPGAMKVGVVNSSTNIGWIPSMFSPVADKDYGWNVVIVLLVAVIVYLYLNKSKQGYEIKVVGDSVETARYAGIRVKDIYVRTMVISGAICGLAGFIAVSGSSHTISTSTAGGRGFTAIIVAWLSKFNTFTMILMSLLIVFLEQGAQQIASTFRLDEHIADIVSGIILFFLLGSEFFCNYRLVFRKNQKELGE